MAPSQRAPNSRVHNHAGLAAALGGTLIAGAALASAAFPKGVKP